MHTAGRARSAGEVKGSINEVARHDFAIMKELFDFDLSVLGNYFSVDCMDALLHYEGDRGRGKIVQQADQRPDRRALPSSGGSGECRRI